MASDDSVSTNEDTPLVITAASLLANDTDIDLDTLSIDSFTQPANGTVVDNGDGTFTYTPTADFNGVDRFAYSVRRERGYQCRGVTIDVAEFKTAARRRSMNPETIRRRRLDQQSARGRDARDRQKGLRYHGRRRHCGRHESSRVRETGVHFGTAAATAPQKLPLRWRSRRLWNAGQTFHSEPEPSAAPTRTTTHRRDQLRNRLSRPSTKGVFTFDVSSLAGPLNPSEKTSLKTRGSIP